MEFDIGDIFYYIVLIIAAIGGIFGKKKKKNPAGSGAEDKSRNILQRLEDELKGFTEDTDTNESGEEEYVPASEEKITEEVFWKERLYDREAAYKESLVDSFEHRFDKEPSRYNAFEGFFDPDSVDNAALLNEAEKTTYKDEILEVEELEEEVHADYDELVKDFDLQAAVIYSAILNRNEY